jgi:hypothetical protein
VPRPGHKKVPPPDQSTGAPFCAPVGAGLIPSVFKNFYNAKSSKKKKIFLEHYNP